MNIFCSFKAKKMKRILITVIGIITALNMMAQRNDEHLRKLSIAEMAVTNLYVEDVNE